MSIIVKTLLVDILHACLVQSTSGIIWASVRYTTNSCKGIYLGIFDTFAVRLPSATLLNSSCCVDTHVIPADRTSTTVHAQVPFESCVLQQQQNEIFHVLHSLLHISFTSILCLLWYVHACVWVCARWNGMKVSLSLPEVISGHRSKI